jgi:hypothetical protein
MKRRKAVAKLARRIKGYDALTGADVNKGQNYHKPGSLK